MQGPRLAAAVAVLLLALPAGAQDARKIRILTTTSDLREIARAVGGDAVEVGSLARGPEDPHFIDARPSFVRRAHDADLFVKVGLDLEVGYEGPIVRDARNPRIQPGAAGYCDASVDVDKLEVPTGNVDRSMGDVHASGNPHYLLDPVRAKAAAASVAESLAAVDPARAGAWREGAKAFARRIDEAMFGARLLERGPARRFESLLAEGRLGAYLAEKGWEGDLGGWAKAMLPHAGRRIVSYHALFTYFADRFHLEEVGRLEPKPGVPPTASHLRRVVETMKGADARIILTAVYNPKDVPGNVARETGSRVVTLAHMPGSLPGTDGYFDFVDANVRAVAAALGGD